MPSVLGFTITSTYIATKMYYVLLNYLSENNKVLETSLFVLGFFFSLDKVGKGKKLASNLEK